MTLGGYIRGGDPATWCPELWTWLTKRFGVRSVLDVGCGEGRSTKFFRDLGCDALGVDGCQQAIDDSVVPDNVLKHDFCDGPFESGRMFDMVWSCEFLEHVAEEFVPNILQTFSQASQLIVITHAFPWQQGHHHVNCQPSDYWIRRIEALGYGCDITSTKQARAVTLGDYIRVNHFARSGLLFFHDSLAPGSGSLYNAVTGARLKSFWINFSFKWSGAYFSHRRRRRAWKRQVRRGTEERVETEPERE